MSREARDLVSKLLTKNPAERIRAEEAMRHEWFKRFVVQPTMSMAEEESLIGSLRNLKNFKAQCTLQRAVLGYIASQLMDPKREQELRAMFDTMDKDRNGEVTKQELYEGYVALYKNKSRARRDTIAVMKGADLNGNGVIEYSGTVWYHVKRDRIPCGKHRPGTDAERAAAAPGLRLLRQCKTLLSSIGG